MNSRNTALQQSFLEIGYFRIILGLYLLYYNIPFLGKLHMYFGTHSMLPDELLPAFFTTSPTFFPWPEYWFTSLFSLMLVGNVCFTLGLLNKISLIPLYLLQLYFYHANPLILHESQPLANLFLFLFFFIPPNSSPLLIKKEEFIFTEESIAEIKQLIKIIILFFGIYYFFVGIKKIPDPLWRDGSALKHILSWPGVARENFMTHFITQTPFISPILSYLTLFFELSFVFLIFTPLRFICIIAGIAFHTGIFLTMDVGTLSQILIVWYALLLDEPTRARFKKICNR